MVGAIGAFSFRDGIATGGQVRSPICRIGNVEHNEQSFPLLTLYRRENTDSGAPGSTAAATPPSPPSSPTAPPRSTTKPSPPAPPSRPPPGSPAANPPAPTPTPSR